MDLFGPSQYILSIAFLVVVLSSVTVSADDCSKKRWFEVTRSGDISGASACLDAGFAVDARDEVGCSALVNAVANRRLHMAKYLVTQGADVNSRCRSGNSALVYAARYGDLDLTKFLHTNGAIVDLDIGPNHSGITPLEEAARNGQFHIVKYLHSVEISMTESWTGNELLWAAANDASDMIRSQLSQGVPITSVDSYGHTALHWAARQGAANAVKTLIDAGADVHARTHDGWTPLMYAAYHGKTEALQALQISGADVADVDHIGWTAATWAAEQGHVNILAMLKSAGANINHVGSSWTPLMVTCARGHYAAAQFLLRRGVDWKLTNAQGQTCEDIACERNPGSEICDLFTNMRQSIDYERSRSGHSEL